MVEFILHSVAFSSRASMPSQRPPTQQPARATNHADRAPYTRHIGLSCEWIHSTQTQFATHAKSPAHPKPRHSFLPFSLYLSVPRYELPLRQPAKFQGRPLHKYSAPPASFRFTDSDAGHHHLSIWRSSTLDAGSNLRGITERELTPRLPSPRPHRAHFHDFPSLHTPAQVTCRPSALVHRRIHSMP
ncbi:uncharacterized protein LY79DRAFT_48367 [Colletotrichum navitas]|uniref:Uncharacterized protein n=1 Tax=Colletotrichum navitas TaxID=681940 RepID=A0AAD8Q7E8_9PEZI|nr:uncharacterized protein LY79DRAFT_48367 [Colletotrichum navitas]KAK1596577.1 hypothetical protein LY79DRAFT_48367 [Colletotrichum navitas]